MNTLSFFQLPKKKQAIMLLVFQLSLISCFAQEKFTSQNNADFQKTIADTAVLLIDVRTPEEFTEGHIPDAVNINVNDQNFDRKVKELPKTKAVAVYCRSGKRSKAAARKLTQQGFKVYELNSGLTNWNGKIVK